MPTKSGGPEASMRRIFICYPRAALDEVVEFHKALQKRLEIRSRSYRIFRDLADDERERVNKADNFRTLIADKLKQSVCCIVILVPSIFESEECAIEVEQFSEAVVKSQRGFFYPIEFSTIRDEIKQAEANGNVIARELIHIDRDSFVDYWSEADRKSYDKKVDDIAREIHRRLGRLQGGGESTEEGDEPRPSPFSWRMPVIAVVAALVLLGGLLAIPAVRDGLLSLVSRQPAPTAWTIVDTAFDPVVQVPTFTQPTVDPVKAGPLLKPGTIAPGIGRVIAIRQGRVDGKDWYELELYDGSKLYVEKHHLPVTWTSMAGCLMTKKWGFLQSGVGTGMNLGEFGAETVLKSAGNQVQSAQFGGELWYRYRVENNRLGYVRSDYVELLAVEKCQ
jgi:hypothetical protein